MIKNSKLLYHDGKNQNAVITNARITACSLKSIRDLYLRGNPKLLIAA